LIIEMTQVRHDKEKTNVIKSNNVYMHVVRAILWRTEGKMSIK